MGDLAKALSSALLVTLFGRVVIGCVVIIDPAGGEAPSAATGRVVQASPGADAARPHRNAGPAGAEAERPPEAAPRVANAIAAALGAGTVLAVVLVMGSRRVSKGRRAREARGDRQGPGNGSAGKAS